MKLFVILTCCLVFLSEIGSSIALPQDNQRNLEGQRNQENLGYQEEQGNQDDQENQGNQDDQMDMSDKMDNFQEGIEICRSNQEQINLLVEKLGDQNSPEEGINQLQKKLNELDEKFEMMAKSPKNEQSNSAPFALVKNLEKKLSRLQYSLDRSMLKKSMSLGTGKGDEKGSGKGDEKGSDKENSSLEETLSDIVTKLDDLKKKSEAENAFESPKEGRHMGKGCRMLAVPYKKLLTSVENVQKIVKDMEGNEEGGGKSAQIRNSVVQDIRSSLEYILEEIQTLRKKNEKNIKESEKILKRIDRKLDSELEDDDEDDEKLKKALKKYMIEQRRILEKKVQKMLKDKKDDDDDEDDDDSDDSDDEKRKNKSKKKKSKDDDDDDEDDEDSDDDDDSDDSDDDDKNSRKKKKNKDDTDDDDDSDDDDKESRKKKKNKDDTDDDDDEGDDDDDDDIECDDSDENGSKSCEREKKKAYSRGKKKPKLDFTDSDSDIDESMPVKGKKMDRKYKVRKDVRDIEFLENKDNNDKLVADEPVQNGNFFWSFLGPQPPDQPTKPNKHPDVTP